MGKRMFETRTWKEQKQGQSADTEEGVTSGSRHKKLLQIYA